MLARVSLLLTRFTSARILRCFCVCMSKLPTLVWKSCLTQLGRVDDINQPLEACHISTFLRTLGFVGCHGGHGRTHMLRINRETLSTTLSRCPLRITSCDGTALNPKSRATGSFYCLSQVLWMLWDYVATQVLVCYDCVGDSPVAPLPNEWLGPVGRREIP